jgi:hypothetical protein
MKRLKKKMPIFFSRSTDQEVRKQILEISGIQATHTYDKVLGVIGTDWQVQNRVWN